MDIITTIEIKRPSGEIEIVDVSDKFSQGLTDGMFATIKAATRKAGKGECLSYQVTRPELSDEAKAEMKKEADRVNWYKKHGFYENQLY